MNSKKKEVVEIVFHDKKFRDLGYYMDSNDGVGHYWPNTEDLKTWYDYIKCPTNETYQIWSLGYLHLQFCDNEDENNNDLYADIIRKNKTKYSAIITKWFTDEGIELNSYFEDFAFGKYSEHGSINFVTDIDNIAAGEDLVYEDGEIIKFLNKNHTFSEIIWHVFIECSRYKEFTNDIEILVEFFNPEKQK